MKSNDLIELNKVQKVNKKHIKSHTILNLLSFIYFY